MNGHRDFLIPVKSNDGDSASVSCMMMRAFFALLFFVACAPAARSCDDAAHKGSVVPVAGTSYAPTMVSSVVEIAPAVGEHCCECPAQETGIASTLVDPHKARLAVPPGNAVLESSLAELHTGVVASGKHLSAAAPPNGYPVYLLTARLRR